MTEEKKNVLDIGIFSKISKITRHLWVNKDKIVATGKAMDPPKPISVRYKPDKEIFNFEFGISGLSEFISAISFFKKISLEYKEPNLLVKNEEASQMVTYRTVPKAVLQEKVIKSTDNAEKLMNMSKELIDQNRYCTINMTEEMTDRLIKAGRQISVSTPAKIKIKKIATSDDVVLTIEHKDSSVKFSTVIPLENPGNILEFENTFNVDCILEGAWKWNIFDTTVEHLGTKIPTVWSYFVNDDEKMEVVVSYDKKK